MKLIVTRFDSADSLNRDAVSVLTRCLQSTGAGKVGVIVSGGRTPLAIYDQLCATGVRAGDDVTILYSDERDVPADSPENNYGNTVPLIQSLGLPANRVLRVHTELGWRESADRYDHDIRGFLASGGTLKLGLLGLGPDGHTSSLFTPDDIALCSGRYAVAIGRPQKPDRVSVTPELMRQVERVIILAVGPEKREIIDKLIQHPDQVVAGLVLKDIPAVELWQA